MDEKPIARLRAALVRHYHRFARKLPWRDTRDPYAIWVSEVMLQQTQVVTVEQRYAAFLGQFPTVMSLAGATEEQVCAAWAGLGYYRRARALHAAARQVMQRFGGVLPSSTKELASLPGIGRYSAGAIASIAFGVEAPAVDGNVMRVLARLYGLKVRPDEPEAVRCFWELAGKLVRGPDPGTLNQALMELGATICLPAAPVCSECPVRSWCDASLQGRPTEFPLAKRRAPRRDLLMAFLFVARRGGVYLARRPLEGLWAGLWELPSASGAGAKAALQARFGIGKLILVAHVRHELTHRRVLAKIYRPASPLDLLERADQRLFSDPLAAPLSVLARKALQAAQAGTGSADRIRSTRGLGALRRAGP